jgi:hypothetical protein
MGAAEQLLVTVRELVESRTARGKILPTGCCGDGKVFRLAEDGKPGKVLLSTKANRTDDRLSNEQPFLQAVVASDPKRSGLRSRPPSRVSAVSVSRRARVAIRERVRGGNP